MAEDRRRANPGEVKVLFLLPYPSGMAPSQRFRVEALLHLLEQRGVKYMVCEFFDKQSWRSSGLSVGARILGVVKGFLRRLKTMIIDATQYTHVFVHREASPIGPAVFEWYAARVLKKVLVYDFDDAVWLAENNDIGGVVRHLKFFSKIAYICRISSRVSVGNGYLAEFAARHSKGGVHIIPTVVDTENRYNRLKIHSDQRRLTIGWTGSRSTVPYLSPLIPVIRKLEESFDFTFQVIADEDPAPTLKNYLFVNWNQQTEISDMLKIDIGIMPLPDDDWSKGKCGFKLIQYLSLGIPAVASDIGVNKEIVDHSVSGFLCVTEDEWYSSLAILLSDVKLREKMGMAGREDIVKSYSINSIEEDFIHLFK